jgi:hypothetical protein
MTPAEAGASLRRCRFGRCDGAGRAAAPRLHAQPSGARAWGGWNSDPAALPGQRRHPRRHHPAVDEAIAQGRDRGLAPKDEKSLERLLRQAFVPTSPGSTRPASLRAASRAPKRSLHPPKTSSISWSRARPSDPRPRRRGRGDRGCPRGTPARMAAIAPVSGGRPGVPDRQAPARRRPRHLAGGPARQKGRRASLGPERPFPWSARLISLAHHRARPQNPSQTQAGRGRQAKPGTTCQARPRMPHRGRSRR